MTTPESSPFSISYNPSSASSLDGLISRLQRGLLPSIPELSFLCALSRQLLLALPNVVPLSTPLSICGDLHGQFFDLLDILHLSGPPPHTSYLFLGDYVDRGAFSLSTLLLLLALHARHPTRVALLRGNHESRGISRQYGFYSECMQKYGDASPWSLLCSVFDCLPLAATIDGAFLCVHGGLAPSWGSVDDVAALDRVRELPMEGAMCDLMWSDPDTEQAGWVRNSRGAGWCFGQEVTERFLRVNGLLCLIRAHQLCHEGYSVLWDKVVTVWSAPNYCGRMGNRASVLQMDEHGERLFNVFTEAPARFTSQQQAAPPSRKAPLSDVTDAAGSASLEAERPSPSPPVWSDGVQRYFADDAESKQRPAHADAEDASEGGEGGVEAASSADMEGWVKPKRIKGLKRNANKSLSIAAQKRGGYAYR